jgi:uncharacterized protein (TIGR03067 family)
MFLTKLKLFALLLVGLGMLGTGGGLLTYGSLATEPGASADEAPAKAGRQAKTDQERIQGTWVVVSGLHDGNAMPRKDIGRFRLSFRGNKMTIPSGTTQKGATFRLHPDKSPRVIEFPTQNFDNHLQVGIYRFQGDRLTLSLGDADKGPPREFTGDAGTRQVLLVLRREKAEAGQGTGDSGDNAALKEENERLRQELQEAREALEQIRRQLAAARDQEQAARQAAEEAVQRARQAVDRAIEKGTGNLSEAAFRRRASNQLKELALAMHAYNETYKHFPPAAIYGKDGRPLLSWRVALLPYLEQQELYRQFHLDEPWDGPHNKKLLEKMPEVFAPVRGSGREQPVTFYQVFTGKGTIFEGRKDVGLANIEDGTANTLLIAEAGTPVPWTKPADLVYREGQPLPRLGGQFKGPFPVALADGSVQVIRRDFDPDLFRLLILRNDGHVLDVDKLTVPR